MKNAVTVTRIGLLVIALASLDSAVGLSVTRNKGKAPADKTVTGKVVYYAEGNMEFNNNVADIEKAFKKRDWEDTKDNPAFRKFVRARYGTEVEKLKTYSKATFWEDLIAYLDEVKAKEADYQKIRGRAVSDELKALFPIIDKARNEFNYAEVNRLLQTFEEKHTGIVQDAATLCYLKAQNYELQINYPEAERYYKKAAVIEDQDPFYLNAYAQILLAEGHYPEAESLFRSALAISEKALGTDHPSVATSLNNLGLLLYHQGKYAEAEPLYRRSLAISEKALGIDHPSVATSLNNLAELLDTQGKYAEAEPLYRRSLAISEKALGTDHPDVAKSLNNLALLLSTEGKYAEAEPLYRRSLAISEKALGTDHPSVATSLNNLGLLLYHQGKYAEAAPLLRRALAISEKALGTDHPNTITCRGNLNTLLKKMQ